jgi:hypothetical protein
MRQTIVPGRMALSVHNDWGNAGDCMHPERGTNPAAEGGPSRGFNIGAVSFVYMSVPKNRKTG